MPVKRPAPRLALIDESRMTEGQRALLEAIRSGPRGASITPRGPFAVWMHAPELGQFAQALGGYCRYKTSLAPRLSEFAILCTAQLWRAQYEWFAHAPIAEEAGVSPKTIENLRLGRPPKVSTERRASNLRIHPGALQNQIASAIAPTRRRTHCLGKGDCRTGRDTRLLRTHFDDIKRVSDVASGKRKIGIRGAEVVREDRVPARIPSRRDLPQNVVASGQLIQQLCRVLMITLPFGNFVRTRTVRHSARCLYQP